jgi:crotonobetainyl-CoA:carnitine CoA-transferase CaiB-like acyl-CoA transferase
MLADLGAEVIKIERPGVGDDTRHWGPPFTTKADGSRGDAAYFLCANRGKKSVELDLATPEGAEIIRELSKTCDVLVENFKTGGLKKYGLDHAALASINPKLIYCSITGFGQDGPDAHRAGYDYMIQAMGGLMSITGQADGAPGAEPMKVGVAVADLFTGLYASNAIMAALHMPGRPGRASISTSPCSTSRRPCWPIRRPISSSTARRRRGWATPTPTWPRISLFRVRMEWSSLRSATTDSSARWRRRWARRASAPTPAF